MPSSAVGHAFLSLFLGATPLQVQGVVSSASQTVTLHLNEVTKNIEVTQQLELATDSELTWYRKSIADSKGVTNVAVQADGQSASMTTETNGDWTFVRMEFEPKMPEGMVRLTLTYTLADAACLLNKTTGQTQLLRLPWLEAYSHPLTNSSYRSTQSSDGVPKGVCFAGRCLDSSTSTMDCPGPCGSGDDFNVTWSSPALTDRVCCGSSWLFRGSFRIGW